MANQPQPRHPRPTESDPPMTSYPKYVLYTPVLNNKTRLLRHHSQPNHEGEYLGMAEGSYNDMKQLLADLTKEEDKGTPEIQGAPLFCRAAPTGEGLPAMVCLREYAHTGDHFFQEIVP